MDHIQQMLEAQVLAQQKNHKQWSRFWEFTGLRYRWSFFFFFMKAKIK